LIIGYDEGFVHNDQNIMNRTMELFQRQLKPINIPAVTARPTDIDEHHVRKGSVEIPQVLRSLSGRLAIREGESCHSCSFLCGATTADGTP
jgi:hypothetical protein